MPQLEHVFYGPIPSKKNGKEWVQMGRRRYLMPSKAYRQWETAVAPALMAAFGSPKLKRFWLELKIFLPDNRIRDGDNILTSIQDCLKKGQVIADDRHQYMVHQPFIHNPEIDRVNPRVELIIHYGEDVEISGRRPGESECDRAVVVGKGEQKQAS